MRGSFLENTQRHVRSRVHEIAAPSDIKINENDDDAHKKNESIINDCRDNT